MATWRDGGPLDTREMVCWIVEGVTLLVVAVAVAYNTTLLLSNFGAYLPQQRAFQQVYITRHGSCTLTLACSNATARNESKDTGRADVVSEEPNGHLCQRIGHVKSINVLVKIVSTRTSTSCLAWMLSKSFLRQLGDSFLLDKPLRLSLCCNPSTTVRCASSASSTRWKSRQANDHFAREARVQGLKSRAAFKLLQVSVCCS